MRHLLLGPEDWGLACQQLPLQHSGQCVLAQWSHNPKAIHLLQIFAHTPSRPPEDSADFSLTVPVDAVADRGAGLLLPSGVRLWTTPTVSMASQVQVCGTSSALSLASLGRLMPGLAVCPGTVVRLGDCELKVLAVDELSPRQWASCGLSTAFQLVASAAPAATASTATEPTPEPQSPLQPVAGLDEALAQLCAMLELPFARGAHFQRLGLDCPRGLLLYGPPGCGKTLLVRTAAAQCSAKLISVRPFLGYRVGPSSSQWYHCTLQCLTLPSPAMSLISYSRENIYRLVHKTYWASIWARAKPGCGLCSTKRSRPLRHNPPCSFSTSSMPCVPSAKRVAVTSLDLLPSF